MIKLPKSLTAAASLGLVLTVSGCSGLSIGKSDFKCEGLGGVDECQSTRLVYEATHQGRLPSDSASEKKTDSDKPALGGEDPNDVVNNFVAPRLPDQPVPIRTPANVMRVWIAPWEDKKGDLVVSGYLYTEIEPRRWVVGDTVSASSDARLFPLQNLQSRNPPEPQSQD